MQRVVHPNLAVVTKILFFFWTIYFIFLSRWTHTLQWMACALCWEVDAICTRSNATKETHFKYKRSHPFCCLLINKCRIKEIIILTLDWRLSAASICFKISFYANLLQWNVPTYISISTNESSHAAMNKKKESCIRMPMFNVGRTDSHKQRWQRRQLAHSMEYSNSMWLIVCRCDVTFMS